MAKTERKAGRPKTPRKRMMQWACINIVRFAYVRLTEAAADAILREKIAEYCGEKPSRRAMQAMIVVLGAAAIRKRFGCDDPRKDMFDKNMDEFLREEMGCNPLAPMKL